MNDPAIVITPDLVKLIAEIDEFKGRWQALEHLYPGRSGTFLASGAANE